MRCLYLAQSAYWIQIISNIFSNLLILWLAQGKFLINITTNLISSLAVFQISFFQYEIHMYVASSVA